MTTIEGTSPAFSRFWFTPDCEMGLHHFEYTRKSFGCLPHTHGEYIISLCLSREFDYHIRGNCETVRVGDLLVTNPGEMHQGSYGPSDAPSDGISVFLTKRALQNIFKEMRVPLDLEEHRVLFLGKPHDSKVQQLARDVLLELQERRTGYEIIVKSCILQILVYLFRNCLEPTVEKTKCELPRQLPWWQMNRTIEYMNTHGKNSFKLAKLCDQVGTSPSRLIRLFKNSANMKNPHSYFNELLIKKAQALLVSGLYSVKEVAYELGFQNDSHFCTVFRHVLGTTPNTFRALQAQTPPHAQACAPQK